MHVHFNIEEETVRVYLKGNENSFENREEYDSIATIKFIGTTAHISASLGKFPIAAYRAILNHCSRRGMHNISWEHKGKEKTYGITR